MLAVRIRKLVNMRLLVRLALAREDMRMPTRDGMATRRKGHLGVMDTPGLEATCRRQHICQHGECIHDPFGEG